MDENLADKLLFELKGRITDAMAAVQVLTPLVREKGDEKDRNYLAAMNKSLYRMLRSMRHLEVCVGKAAFSPRSLDLAGLCRDVGGQCESMAKMLDISFEWSLDQSSVISVGDSHLLELALLNMLTNAFEAAGPGGRVIMRGEQKRKNWVVSVRDDGPGLRQRQEDEDPFLKKPGGVGLGREVTQTVAKLHGGRELLHSEAGEGAEAVLSLPIRKPEKEMVRAPRTPVDPRGGFSSTLVEFSPLLPMESFSINDTE